MGGGEGTSLGHCVGEGGTERGTARTAWTGGYSIRHQRRQSFLARGEKRNAIVTRRRDDMGWGPWGMRTARRCKQGEKGRERYPGGFSAIPWNWQKRRCSRCRCRCRCRGGQCRGGCMWPGGRKASDACTAVPTLPRACTRRRTGYLVPGPRHNRTEGQKKSSAPSCLCWARPTIRDDEGEGEDEGDT